MLAFFIGFGIGIIVSFAAAFHGFRRGWTIGYDTALNEVIKRLSEVDE